MKARLPSRLISSVLEVSRNFRETPLYPWASATPIRMAPTTATMVVPPVQSSTPPVVFFGLLDP
ncbi:MAG: hypothetical protein ACXVW5_25360, partial [Solirubrobacteraceae bacterium]